jgi:hypothetical protein
MVIKHANSIVYDKSYAVIFCKKNITVKGQHRN